MNRLFGLFSAALFAACLAAAGLQPAGAAPMPAGASTGIDAQTRLVAQTVRHHGSYGPRRGYYGPRGVYRGPVWRGPVYRGPFFYRPIYRGPAYYPYPVYRRCYFVRRWVWTPYGRELRRVRVCR